MPTPTISVVIPALNEERYLGPTLDAVHAAAAHLLSRSSEQVEIIVVDNGSQDRTVEVARSRRVVVVTAPQGNVATARNAGARSASGQLLVFVDADTLWPEPLLSRIHNAFSDKRCLGGGVDTDYRPQRFLIRAYVRFWRLISKLTSMAQGATQFCRADAFASLGGYDESMFMGEDVDFYWRLQRLARKTGGTVEKIADVKVVPSCRRFDQWPIWKTLLLTNPLVCALFARRKKPWSGWYDHPTR